MESEDIAPSLKVTWKAKKGDPTNGGYSKDLLETLFAKVRLIYDAMMLLAYLHPDVL